MFVLKLQQPVAYLAHSFPGLFWLERPFGQKHGVLSGIDAELLEERMVPHLLHGVPVYDQAFLQRGRHREHPALPPRVMANERPRLAPTGGYGCDARRRTLANPAHQRHAGRLAPPHQRGEYAQLLQTPSSGDGRGASTDNSGGGGRQSGAGAGPAAVDDDGAARRVL